eukprot:3940476-Rhodomonas_salina.1
MGRFQVTPKYYLIHIQRYGMFFIAVLNREVTPLLVTEFLHRVVDVFRDYFNEVLGCLSACDARARSLLTHARICAFLFLHVHIHICTRSHSRSFDTRTHTRSSTHAPTLLHASDKARQVSEESIKENFITVYQLMDEVLMQPESARLCDPLY